MRKITAGRIGFILALLAAIILQTASSTNLFARKAWLGDFYAGMYVFLPVILVYVLLGTRFGANSFSPRTILDPPLTAIGDNTIIGRAATLNSDAIEGRHFALERFVLGSNLTVGARAGITPGLTSAMCPD